MLRIFKKDLFAGQISLGGNLTGVKKMQKLSVLDMISVVLVIVGGLNWGLVGLAGFNLVDTIFGSMSLISRLVYLLVGLSAIYLAVNATKLEKK